MKCTYCGNQIDNKAVFCTYCGTKTKKYENVKRISLRCKFCDGVLEVKEDSTVLECPYCGAKELIYFNDKKKTAENKSPKKGITAGSVFLIICAVISLIISLCHFILNLILPALLSLLQAAGFITAFVLKLNNPDKKKFSAIIIALSWALAVPSMVTCYYQYETGANLPNVEWDIFFLGDKIPEPDSKKIEISTNSDEKLHIKVYGISEQEFYRYVADCKTVGYSTETEQNYSDYKAFNADGYGLELRYYDNEMTIELNAPTKLTDLNWELHEISKALPVPPSEKGLFKFENSDRTEVIVGEMTAEMYAEYFAKVKGELGYSIEAEQKSTGYTAFNPDGYEIQISHTVGNREMKITLYQPRVCVPFTMPASGVGALLPVPKSQSGEVNLNNPSSFSVYVADMTLTDFNDYVSRCIDAGFSKNVRKYDKSYYADYSSDKDISITVSYEGFNIVYVYIRGEYDKDYSNLTR